MTRSLASALAATALVAVACVQAPPAAPEPEPPARLRALAAALAARDTDPAQAAAHLEAAGSGGALERLRHELWVDALERSSADAERWQRLADEPPAAAIGRRVRLGLATALLAGGRRDEALALLQSVPAPERAAADRLLVGLGGDAANAAARRLAVAEPALLERENRELARSVAASLGPEARLERARRWRELGAPSRAVDELRSGGWPADLERQRRVELARAELGRGSPSRALAALPSGRDPGPEARVVRSAALRAQGWSRMPDDDARRSFRDCLEAVRPLAAAAPGGSVGSWREAQQLLLECGTEAGELTAAVNAWRSLERAAWSDPRRDWLGRRLGVALARAGRAEALELAAALPDHERCLAFWVASTEPVQRQSRLAELAAAPVSDLYGGWARQRLGIASAAPPHFAGELSAASAPSPVAWLLERGEPGLALGEWRRVHESRGLHPAEAVAAAELAARLGRRNEVIAWLRVGFPEVTGPRLGTSPENVVRAYLPLEWVADLVAAARSQGLPPSLVAAIARQESTFDPRARSSAGAVGVLQLMPGTARGHARALGLGLRPDLTDPALNLRLGSRELAVLIRRFGAVEPALAAYNAGETRVRTWWRRWPDRQVFVESIPIPETYTYVRRVIFLAEAYRVTYPELDT